MDLFNVSQENQHLLEMANLVGKTVNTDVINFSFYFSDKFVANHGIRVKIIWNRNKMQGDNSGYLELHGDYKYESSNDSKKILNKEIEKARTFFQKYKILFAAVWECELDPNYVVDYLRKKIDFKELLNGFDELENDNLNDWKNIKQANNILDLEKIVRQYKLFNMND